MVKYVPAHRRLSLIGPTIDQIERSILSFRKYRPEDVPYLFSRNVLEVSTNIGCKVNCYYCPQKMIVDRYLKTSETPPVMLSMTTFEKCLQTVPIKVDLTFSGFSEPFQNPCCSDMILYSFKRGHQIRAYTTLVGLDLESYQKIRTLPFKEFVIHLPDLEQTSNIPITADYLDLLETIATEPPSGIRFVILGRNVDPRISKILTRQGFTIVLIPLTDRVGNLPVSGIEIAKPYLKRGRIECLCRLRNNLMLPDGRVHLCFNDFGLKHNLGNLLEDRYPDLFISPEFKLVERSHMDPSLDSNCRHCMFSVRIK